MAQRYGGAHSPEGHRPRKVKPMQRLPGRGRQHDPAGFRANLMWLPPVLLAFGALDEGAAGLLWGLASAGVLGLGAWLLRDGLRAEAVYATRETAKRPAIPRKIFAATLAGVGIAGAALMHGTDTLSAVLYGAAAGVLHVASFGIDPLRDKLAEGMDPIQRDRVARVVNEAEAYLAEMMTHIHSLGDRRLELKVISFQDTARGMIHSVESDPRDLTAARKYLGVYLMGARDAAEKFARHYAHNADAGMREDFEALLVDLEENFASRTEAMLENNRGDLDVEIKVLRDRLAREGLKPKDE